MAGRKRDLGNLLGQPRPEPEIRRGQGYVLSTETEVAPAEEPGPVPGQGTNAHVHMCTCAQPVTQAEPPRSTRGFRLRADLVRELKLLAAREDRKLYEVMEEALEEYLRRRR